MDDERQVPTEEPEALQGLRILARMIASIHMAKIEGEPEGPLASDKADGRRS